jgi:hypothetical protein
VHPALLLRNVEGLSLCTKYRHRRLHQGQHTIWKALVSNSEQKHGNVGEAALSTRPIYTYVRMYK